MSAAGGTTIVRRGAKPYEPYPPGVAGTVKRDDEAVEGKPVPLYIKNTDVAKCLNALATSWAGRTLAGRALKEANLEIYHGLTGSKVADGEVVLDGAGEGC